MNTLDAEIEQIVQMIWSSLIEVPLEPAPLGGASESAAVTGVVGIDGAWRGAVVVRCPFRLASVVTATMFDSGDEPPFDDIRDAIGELTNMIAGNIKALLPQPSTISLPTVALGAQYEIGVTGARVVAEVAFSSASLPLVVTVMQQSDSTQEVIRDVR